MDEWRAAGRQTGEGLFRQMRPLYDDAERSGQRPPDLSDRCGGAAPRRIRYLPYRPMDGRSQSLSALRYIGALGEFSGGQQWLNYARTARTGNSTSWSTWVTATPKGLTPGFRRSAASAWRSRSPNT